MQVVGINVPAGLNTAQRSAKQNINHNRHLKKLYHWDQKNNSQLFYSFFPIGKKELKNQLQI